MASLEQKLTASLLISGTTTALGFIVSSAEPYTKGYIPEYMNKIMFTENESPLHAALKNFAISFAAVNIVDMVFGSSIVIASV